MSLNRPKDVATKFGCSIVTLRRWEAEGKLTSVRTHGNHRRYIDPSINSSEPPVIERKHYAYCRVSSSKQKDDLERQKQAMQETHPDHEIITDIGSGLNFKRKGLLRLVDSILRGHVKEVVIAHRDRLCRFGFELLQWLCDRSNTDLVVKNQEVRTASEELSDDLMAIVHVISFVSSEGLR